MERLREAAERRGALAATTDCYRLHDAGSDALPGVYVERYADHAVLSLTSEAAVAEQEALGRALLELGLRGVYVKLRLRADLRRLAQETLAPATPLAGAAAPEELTVFEAERRYLVRLADGLSTGLFVDQRDNRARVQRDCDGARVLNLFCYTGSFSVAAGLGGAASVVSVDSSRRALERLDRNLRLNQLPKERHRLLSADAQKWLARAVRRGEHFDWIILDPPSFSSSGKASFSVDTDYARLAEDCARLLAPEGRLLATTNHKKTSRKDFARLLAQAASRAGKTITESSWPEPPIDCPLGNDPETAPKSFLLRVA